MLMRFFCSPNKSWGDQAGQSGRPRLHMPLNSPVQGGSPVAMRSLTPGSCFRSATGSRAHSMGSGPGATPASLSLCTSSSCALPEQASAGPRATPLPGGGLSPRERRSSPTQMPGASSIAPAALPVRGQQTRVTQRDAAQSAVLRAPRPSGCGFRAHAPSSSNDECTPSVSDSRPAGTMPRLCGPC